MGDRILKINAEIQKALSEIICYELKNPLIKGIISVTKVDTTPDLDFCKIYISIFDKNNEMEIFNQIKHSAGFIRKELCGKVDLRKVPFLEFFLDKSYENSLIIEEKLKLINEKRAKEGNNTDENK